MVTHTEAKTNWHKIYKVRPPFPFKDTMRSAQGAVDTLTSMSKLYMYFKHLSPKTVGAYITVKELWLKLIQYIPEQRYTEPYQILTQYFSQKQNYTPIRLKDAGSLV